jgi:hypothetical protein
MNFLHLEEIGQALAGVPLAISVDESNRLCPTDRRRPIDLVLRPDCKSGRIKMQTNVRNSLNAATRIRCDGSVSLAPQGPLLLMKTIECDALPGDSNLQLEMLVPHHQHSDLQTPTMCRVTLRIEAEQQAIVHEISANCGFRDFRVVNGFFRLNGRPLFLRGTHTGNHCPFGPVVPPSSHPDILLRFLLRKVGGLQYCAFRRGNDDAI